MLITNLIISRIGLLALTVLSIAGAIAIGGCSSSPSTPVQEVVSTPAGSVGSQPPIPSNLPANVQAQIEQQRASGQRENQYYVQLMQQRVKAMQQQKKAGSQ